MATHLDLEEQEQLEQIKHFWNKWGTPITAVAVVVMAGFAGWNGWQYWQQRQALQASAVADVVVAAVASGDQARALQAFDTVKADYKGTLQADHAALVLAQSEVDANKLAEAKSALQWVVDNSKDEGYQATAKLRLAAVLMQEKDLDAAAALLRTSFPQNSRAWQQIAWAMCCNCKASPRRRLQPIRRHGNCLLRKWITGHWWASSSTHWGKQLLTQ